MVTVQEAILKLSDIPKSGIRKNLPLSQSLGHFIAEDIVSPMDVPSFDNSAMDGYAVCWDNEIPENFKLRGTIAAGDIWNESLTHGEAVRIFTGACIPPGCKSVIQQEWALEQNGWVHFVKPITDNLNIRLKGSQSKKNQIVVSEGQKINSGIVGLLATLGISEIAVFDQITVSIIITGNELIEIGNAPQTAKIFNSNGPMLLSLFAEKSIHTLPYSRCLDDPKALKLSILTAMEKSSIIVLTGGISVGDFDFVKAVLDEIGVAQLFYKIQQKPGKPLYVGTHENKVFIALPGNPASVYSCFHAWVNPIVQQLNGGPSVSKFYEDLPSAKLVNSYFKKPGLTHFVKATAKNGEITILTGQESFNLSTLNTANSLAILPEQVEEFSLGTSLKFIPFNN